MWHCFIAIFKHKKLKPKCNKYTNILDALATYPFNGMYIT